MPEDKKHKEHNEQWTSRLGIILAVAGSAVGLGNFLRFPGQVVQNGGGAFMIPYIIALVLLGIPIGWVEWAMARHGGNKGFHSCPGILGVVGRGRPARYLGVLGLLIPLIIYMYYVLIESWCLSYFYSYLVGEMDLGTDPNAFAERSGAIFLQTTGAAQDGLVVQGGLHQSVVFWIITFALNFYVLLHGISKGIERFTTWAMPLMALCATLVLVRVLTLGTPNPNLPERNVIAGLGFMWNPDLSKLGEFNTWLAAAGQIFFSLSVGFGVIINYASYLRRKDDVVLSGLSSAATNELFEVGFGGMITITAAFIFLGASGAIGSTFGLGFNTLPVVFQYMGPVGRLIGAVWFFMLFLAAITSSLSMLQPVLAFMQEALGISRRRGALWLGLLSGLGSLWVVYFSKDLVALDTMDFWVGTALIFVLATIQIICFGWVWGVDRGLRSAHLGARLQIPPIYRFIIKWVAPVYLLVVFVGFCIQSLPGYIASLDDRPVARWTLIVIGVVFALLIYLTRLGEIRWREQGMDLDGLHDEEEGHR